VLVGPRKSVFPGLTVEIEPELPQGVTREILLEGIHLRHVV